MKKNVIKLFGSLFIVSVILASCNTRAGKIKDAKENVIEAKEDLDEAGLKYQAEMENYRKVSSEKIMENEKTIADFRVKIENKKKEVKADYEAKIAALDQKNKNLKQKMNEYKATGKVEWEEFKSEFNHDMDELGNAFQSLVVDNEN